MIGDGLVAPNMMARIYLREAKATRWRNWKISLLGYAAKRRAMYFEVVRAIKKPESQKGQLDMFA
jgi:hypothetical protein